MTSPLVYLREFRSRDAAIGQLTTTAYVALLLLDAAFVSTQRGARWPVEYWIGLAFAVAVLVGVILLPSAKPSLDERASIGIPIVLIFALGLMSMQEASRAEYLMVFSAWWLGIHHAYRGVAISIVTSAIAIAPAAVVGGVTRSDAIMLIGVALLISLSSAVTADNFARTKSGLLRARRQRDTVLQAAEVGIVVLNRFGEVINTNPSMRDFARLTHGGLDPRHAGDETHLSGTAKFDPLLPHELPTVRAMRGEEFEGDLVWAGSRDRHRIFAVSARSVRTPDCAFDGAVLAYQDVTDLMRALRVKDDFVASVSHELRTPLTSIRGYVELLLDGDADDNPQALKQYLSRVLANADRLQHLVEDMLHTTTTDAPDIRPVRMNVADVIPNVRHSLGERARAAGVALHVAPDEVWVDGDPMRLEQVVENLVSNAIKYNHPGGEVWVTCEASDHAVIKVSDNGRGIPQEEQPYVFERFHRALESHRDAIAGVGLGLSITRDIVRAHGGNIILNSEVGQGTTFTVRLPRQTAA